VLAAHARVKEQGTLRAAGRSLVQPIILGMLALGACGEKSREAGETADSGAPSTAQGDTAAKQPAALEATASWLVQHAGKPLVVGSASVIPGRDPALPTTHGRDFFLMRLSGDGTVDKSFGRNGYAVVDFTDLSTSGGSSDALMAVDVAPDGKIALAGRGASTTLGLGAVPALARLLPDGSADPAFGRAGRVLYLPKGVNREDPLASRAVRFDRAGRLYAYGAEKFGPSWLLRFDAAGAIDPTFSNQGAQIDPGVGIPRALVVTDERVIAVSDDFGFAAFTHDGALDKSFGKSGYLSAGEGSSYAAAQRADGTIVVAGTLDTASSEPSKLKLVALSPSGALVPAFGAAGIVELTISEPAILPRGMAAAPDGSLFIAYSMLSTPYLLKVSASGSIDESFGEGGKKKLPYRVSLADLSEVNSNQAGLVGDTVWLTANDTTHTPSQIVTAPVSR
jgi:uncharacterized delta-60 repeat protein